METITNPEVIDEVKPKKKKNRHVNIQLRREKQERSYIIRSIILRIKTD